MNGFHRAAFFAAAALTVGVALWTYVWYTAAPAFYSDLSEYGIEYGSETVTRIADTTQKLIRIVAIPLLSTALIALAGWGYSIFVQSRRQTWR